MDIAALNKLSDERLAELSLSDPYYYGPLVERHYKNLLKFVVGRYVHDLPNAEDIVQESFVRAYLSLSKFDTSRKLKTWLYRIAINCAFNFLRQADAENIEQYSQVLLSEQSPEIFTDAQIQRKNLQAAFGMLDSQERMLLEFHYQENYSLKQISKAAKMPLAEAKIKIQRARRKLELFFRN